MQFLSRFLTKGTMSAAGAVVAWLMGQYGYADLAATLTDPSFLQSIFNWIAMGLTIYAGVAQGVKPHDAKSVSEPILQPQVSEMVDPFPGWDWSPLKGWVQKNGE
jgi:hypothetical protein